MRTAVQIKEFDGGRTVEMAKMPGFIVLETGSQAFAFDEAQFLHQMKRLFRVSVILEHDEPAGEFALP